MPIPDMMPFYVVSLKGLVNPIAVYDKFILFCVPLILAAVAFDAILTDELTVFSILPLPAALKAGIVLFILATRYINVCPITDESSFEEYWVGATRSIAVLACYNTLSGKNLPCQLFRFGFCFVGRRP